MEGTHATKRPSLNRRNRGGLLWGWGRLRGSPWRRWKGRTWGFLRVYGDWGGSSDVTAHEPSACGRSVRVVVVGIPSVPESVELVVNGRHGTST